MPKRKVKRPLSTEYVQALRLDAAKHRPTGPVLSRSDLFPDLEKMAASLWEPSAIEDAYFAKMRERRPQTA
jgi:hypothetical protein